jgi:transposase
VQRDYDKYLYKLRHLVENAVLRLKDWRGIATRYAKRASSYLAIVQIRCLILWMNIS